MPPIVALWLCFGLIYWLFRMDMRQRRFESWHMLVPFTWLFLISSRPLSFWLAWLGLPVGATSNLEGNPVDLVMYLFLICAAGIILAKRRFSWLDFIAKNKLLILLYAYLVLSATWSEHSFPALKRIVKDFGSVVVALVVLTNRDPLRGVTTICVRAAYLLLPLSVVFMKYFPEIGRQSARSGSAMFQGACMHKSSLGAIIFLFGIFIILDIIELRRAGGGRIPIYIRYFMLLIGFWCMRTCGSATSFICFTTGCFALWATGRLVQLRNPAQMLFRCFVVGVFIVAVEKTFNISDVVLEALGKNKTLTGRTEIWDLVKHVDSNPIIGAGYLSFWESAEAEKIAATFAGYLNSSHNGFLDMYLEGGFIGVGLLVIMLLGWARGAVKRMLSGTMFGRMAFIILLLGILFNNSETAFFRLDPVWFVLLLMMIDPAVDQIEPVEVPVPTESALQAA
jgi:exopolysaccharide production protein ExoQ